jgi:hypothetical protein
MSEELLNESPRGFISAPTWEDIQPTPAEQAELENLWEWLERSRRSVILLGIPKN